MLCLEENRNLIEVTSIEGIQLQISAILYAHFPVYFEVIVFYFQFKFIVSFYLMKKKKSFS